MSHRLCCLEVEAEAPLEEGVDCSQKCRGRAARVGTPGGRRGMDASVGLLETKGLMILSDGLTSKGLIRQAENQ